MKIKRFKKIIEWEYGFFSKDTCGVILWALIVSTLMIIPLIAVAVNSGIFTSDTSLEFSWYVVMSTVVGVVGCVFWIIVLYLLIIERPERKIYYEEIKK